MINYGFSLSRPAVQQYGSRLCEIRLIGHVPKEVGDLRLSVDVVFGASERGCLGFFTFYNNYLDTHIKASQNSITYHLFST